MTTDRSAPSATSTASQGVAAAWPIESALLHLVAERVGPAEVHGMLGAMFQSTAVSAIYADFEALYLPGLRALGLDTRISPVTLTDFQSTRIERDFGVPVFRFSGQPIEVGNIEPEDEDADADVQRLSSIDRERVVEESGRIISIATNLVTWEDLTGKIVTDSAKAFERRFGWMVRWSGGPLRIPRRPAFGRA